MSQQTTYVCDQCGKSEICTSLPPTWRRVSLESIDAALRGDYSADVCSPECAGAWASAAFKADLPR